MISYLYNELKEHFQTAGGRDPRTADLPLCNSYAAVIGIIVVYVLFVKKIGPAFMAKRKPYNIRWLISLYNLAQVIFNAYVFIRVTKHFVFHSKYSWYCMPSDYTDFSEDTMQLRKYGYFYFLNKISDTIDTLFFVLTKKYSHISLLHVYHHATMIWGSFLYMNVLFASNISVIGYVNALVHAVMYFYYFLTSLKLNLDLNKWKSRLTTFQLVQFFYFAIRLFIVLTHNTCGLPNFWLWKLYCQEAEIDETGKK
ncbi:elongation of very long chain fatty acids protein AAEL008004-like [Musca vetustissima]|uniref:elongation of very long chain fatty acids protein AAEL008004-like n=1 Tax=Musca vetustissima TaxID=27455 RepID=UPI002AB7A4CF|nr:elongation of very long chain fatty acids protein AAEL008004-like [Musca vetustissima]